MFIGLLSVCIIGNFCESLAFNSGDPIKFISLNNLPCKTRLTLIEINPNKKFLYPFPAKVNKCGGSCNTDDDPYAPVCVPNKEINMNVKAFNLKSRLIKT